MLVKQLSNFLKDKKEEGANIKVLKFQGEADNGGFSAPVKLPEQNNAKLIEDKKLKIRQIQRQSGESGFAYFLDGIERKRVIFYCNFIPATYGYIAAVVMKRTNKKMHSIGLEYNEENIYLPYKQLGDEPENYFDFADLDKYGIKPVNTGKQDKKTGEYPLFPEQFEQNAHIQIQKKRTKKEKNLAEEWLGRNFNDGWLFIDGNLSTKSDKLLFNSNVAGIIKSHNARYFEPEDQFKIYSMKKGQRSSVFQPERKYEEYEKQDVYSWYLKIHENKYNGDNTFGIIRIEIPAKEKFLEQIDIISNWILLETNPVAFPASRWDRMIYPIKYCEDYLRSKAPSWTQIESLSY